jgi:hypothetical protein
LKAASNAGKSAARKWRKIEQEKAINHGEHGVKTTDCITFGIHPLGEAIKERKLPFSVFSVPSVVSNCGF